jgi:hypothetical protein
LQALTPAFEVRKIPSVRRGRGSGTHQFSPCVSRVAPDFSVCVRLTSFERGCSK